MSRAFHFNFDFESELAAWPRAHVPLASDRAIARELAPCGLALGESGDVALVDEPTLPGALDVLRAAGLPLATPVTSLDGLAARPEILVPWGFSPSAVQRARDLGLRCDGPPVEVVRRANSKLWSHALERELGASLDGALVVGSPEVAARGIAALGAGARWVLKSPFGVAGRGRLLGQRPLDASGATWAARATLREGALLLEPWVRVSTELGIQLEIEARGGSRVIGITESIVDAGGHWIGARIGAGVSLDPETRTELERTAGRVGARLVEDGYYGPAGIDSFLHGPPGNERLRPIVEVNARRTMGMIALRFGPLLADGAAASWIIVPRRIALEAVPDELLRRSGLGPYDPARRLGAILATPRVTRARTVTGALALLLVAPSRAALIASERSILGRA